MKRLLALCLSLILITMGLIAGFNTVTVAGFESNINTSERFNIRESDWGKIATVTNTFNIAPGEKYYIYFDNNTKTLEKMTLNDPFNDLPAAAQNAVLKVPDWLKQNLTRKFIDIGTTYATTYADLINNPGDNKYIDEIAFTIAYTSAELLTGSEVFPDLFRQNAEILYSNDQYIDFADIIEYSDYSTVKYKLNESGTINFYELPKEIYYWYVVHPKISDDTPMYIDPNNGNRASPPTGKFWRDYLFNHNDSAYPPDTNTSTVLFPKNATPPLLKELLSGVNTLWNNTPYQAPSGYNNTGENNQRNFSFGDHAIEKISNWVCKTLPLNVEEEGKRINGDPDRSVQPVRIADNHYGNCGELSDLTVAAARTALIPARAISDRGEDHVWQEFWDREWHHWDNWWSDGGGPVDKPEYIINGKTA
ncbi:MAG: transglutaminase domain-containing protein, partial [Thermoplasmata archaeon]|nr:transglutaminase domain-containing protein [Thermoplasmata archaeon]